MESEVKSRQSSLILSPFNHHTTLPQRSSYYVPGTVYTYVI